MRYSADEIDEMRRRGESRTDWARVDARTQEEVEAAIDREDEGKFDWDRAMIGFPSPKRQVTVRFDGDLIEWFKARGPGYQTRMNAVLRGYVGAQKRAELAAARDR